MGFDCLDLLSVLLLGSSCTRVVGVGLMSLGLYLCLCAEYLGCCEFVGVEWYCLLVVWVLC